MNEKRKLRSEGKKVARSRKRRCEPFIERQEPTLVRAGCKPPRMQAFLPSAGSRLPSREHGDGRRVRAWVASEIKTRCRPRTAGREPPHAPLPTRIGEILHLAEETDLKVARPRHEARTAPRPVHRLAEILDLSDCDIRGELLRPGEGFPAQPFARLRR